jgi:Transglutaminase-like superfamily
MVAMGLQFVLLAPTQFDRPSRSHLTLLLSRGIWLHENTTDFGGQSSLGARRSAKNGRSPMLKLLALSATIGVAGGIGALTVLTARMYRRLPTPSRVAMDGITTILDAVAACRRSGRTGWELVAYAQQLVAHKFTYSRLNTWDTPARAFERGRGYCEQQALALKAIYDALGIQTRPVFAVRCAFPSKTEKDCDCGTSLAVYSTLRGLGGSNASWLPGELRHGVLPPKLRHRTKSRTKQ